MPSSDLIRVGWKVFLLSVSKSFSMVFDGLVDQAQVPPEASYWVP
jgi:hypothetical protein